MSVKLKYVASSGREYDLKTSGLLKTRTANYHIWTWGVEGTKLQFGTRVSTFTREAAQYTTQLILDGSIPVRKKLLDDLHEDFELDVRNKRMGRIIWGEYYIDCYIIASSTYPDSNDWWTDNDLTIYCPYPFWIKDHKRSFFGRHGVTPTNFLDYEFDYEYDWYIGDPGTAVWDAGLPFASEFEMTIFGPVSNPRVTINGWPYGFNDTLSDDEYATINSRNNTVIKRTSGGHDISIFDTRFKAQSIFTPIPAGSLEIAWSGLFGFDITLFEERSEPRWNM